MPTYRNIYQSARERAGLTQEAAAERLYIAPETLRTYESGRRRPSDEMVAMMAELYGYLPLGYQHLKTGVLGAQLPDLAERSLQECTMRLFRLLHRFAQEERLAELLEIAEDGVIDDNERPVYQEIMEELRAIVATVMSISIGVENNKKPAHRTAIR